MKACAFDDRDREELMEISCSMLPAEDGTVLMALDALLGDGRTLFVGLGQGKVKDGDAHLSPVGQACLSRLLRHSGNQPVGVDGAVHLVEIQRFNRVGKRMREAFAAAKQGDTLFFVCGDGHIYDAVFAQLNVQLRPGAMTQH
jgi:hypothetical protein